MGCAAFMDPRLAAARQVDAEGFQIARPRLVAALEDALWGRSGTGMGQRVSTEDGSLGNTGDGSLCCVLAPRPRQDYPSSRLMRPMASAVSLGLPNDERRK